MPVDSLSSSSGSAALLARNNSISILNTPSRSPSISNISAISRAVSDSPEMGEKIAAIALSKSESGADELRASKNFLNEEQKRVEEERKKIEEEKIKMEEQKKKMEEEQKKMEEQKRIVEEQKRKLEEQKRIEEQRRNEEKEKKIEEERKRLEEEKKQMEEEQRKIKEEKRRMEEEKIKMEEERKRIQEAEEEKRRLLVEQSMLEKLKLEEEEKKRKREEEEKRRMEEEEKRRMKEEEEKRVYQEQQLKEKEKEELKRIQEIGAIEIREAMMASKSQESSMSDEEDVMSEETFPKFDLPLEPGVLPVAWMDDSDAVACASCEQEFGPFRRKHHCRNCGNIFCNSCSLKKRILPKLGYSQMQRVCDSCARTIPSSEKEEKEEKEIRDAEKEQNRKSKDAKSIWMDNSMAQSCVICDSPFNAIVRKHHCRCCGIVVCDNCSPTKMPLPHLGYTGKVRVCSRCIYNAQEEQATKSFISSALEPAGIEAISESLQQRKFLDFSQNFKWVDDSSVDACMQCTTVFGVLKRKHHCRNCGRIFCDKCTSKSAFVPRLNSKKKERVCDGCFFVLSAATNVATLNVDNPSVTLVSSYAEISPKASNVVKAADIPPTPQKKVSESAFVAPVSAMEPPSSTISALKQSSSSAIVVPRFISSYFYFYKYLFRREVGIDPTSSLGSVASSAPRFVLERGVRKQIVWAV